MWDCIRKQITGETDRPEKRSVCIPLQSKGERLRERICVRVCKRERGWGGSRRSPVKAIVLTQPKPQYPTAAQHRIPGVLRKGKQREGKRRKEGKKSSSRNSFSTRFIYSRPLKASQEPTSFVCFGHLLSQSIAILGLFSSKLLREGRHFLLSWCVLAILVLFGEDAWVPSFEKPDSS